MKSLRLLPLLPLLLSMPTLLRADVRMPALFGDHMVLQRDLAIPVWGWADPGEAVAVTLGTGANAATATATAGDDGAWKVKLPAAAAAGEPTELAVKGKNALLFKDVLVGDVWVCSGQSNMEFGIGSFATPDELAAAGDPQLRLFSVPKRVSPAPEKEIAPAPPNFPLLASWQVCTPDSLRKSGEWSGFSAVGYYFGKELRAWTKQPVGLVESCWGGTRIQSWISLAMLETMPNKASAAKGAANFRDHYQEIGQAYAAAYQQWKEASDKWEAENKDALAAYGKAMEEWRTQSRAASAQGQP
ncbi:MAG TPA: sialate O-acetylesterase, partial [Candidatus Methylacidiphilales bacterium]